jgi:GxxExxY protein
MKLLEKDLVYSVVGAGFEVYNELGFGFREHVYQLALERELLARGHRVAREVNVRVFYKGLELTTDRLDMIVDEKLIVEVKATSERPKGAAGQLLGYLRATTLEVGLLLHFGPKRLDRLRLVASNEFKSFHPRLHGLEDANGRESSQ